MGNFLYKPFGRKRVKTTKYLYGVSPLYFEGKEYYEVVEEKMKLAKELMRELSEKTSEIFKELQNTKDSKKREKLAKEYDEVAIRFSDVAKAYEYNQLLLEEYKKAKRQKEN